MSGGVAVVAKPSKNDDQKKQGMEDPLIEAAFEEARRVGAGQAQTVQGRVGAGSFHLPTDALTGYRLVREIHRGGQGVVYQAVQESTQRSVAVKVLKEGPFAGARDRARFEREVHILGRLQHPNIVAIQDTGVAAGCHFFVMDYVSGQTLDVYMASTERKVDECLILLAKVCDAVHAAHVNGIIHRDLKPSNIRVDSSGEPHVLDFGLAKLSSSASPSQGELTVTGQFVGSLPWASPEQADGRPDRIDVRTDVYSLGVVLYQMLTNRFPYEVAGNVGDVLENIRSAVPVPPRKITRGLGDEVETIVLTCIQKEKERRYQTAGELARDIRRYLDGLPIEAKRDSSLYLLRKMIRRYWLPALIAASFVVVVTAGLILSLFFWRTSVNDRNAASEASTMAQTARDETEEERRLLERSLYFNRVLLARHAVEDNDAMRTKQLLDECPPGLRGFEWHRLQWLSDRSSRTLSGHEGTVFDVEISPGGQELATAGEDGSIRVWHVSSGYELHNIEAHAGPVRGIVFDPSGKMLASCGEDGRLHLWSTETGLLLDTLLDRENSLRCVGFSPGGDLLAAGDETGRLLVFDMDADGKSLVSMEQVGGVFSLAFSLDGRLLVSGGGDGSLCVWDPDEGLLLRRFSGHAAYIPSVGFDPEGLRIVSGGVDGAIKVWDLVDGSLQYSIRGHGSWIYSVGFILEGTRLLTAGSDHTIKMWEADHGTLMKTLRGHEDRVYAAALGPGNRLIASASRDSTVRLWDIDESESAIRFSGHDSQVWAVRFAPDGDRVVSGASDQTVRIWPITDPTSEPRILEGHGGDVVTVDVSPDGRQIASADRKGMVRVWDLESGDLLRSFEGHRAMIHQVSFHSGGAHLLTCARDKTLKMWDARSGTLEKTFSGHDSPVLSAVFSPDGRRIASSSTSGNVIVWDVDQGIVIDSFRAHDASVYSLSWGADGKTLVTASVDGTLRVFTQHGDEIAVLQGHRGGVRCVAVSPDGSRIASGGWDSTVRVWDTATGSLALILRGHEKRVDSVAFSADGRKIASSSLDGRVLIWESE